MRMIVWHIAGKCVKVEHADSALLQTTSMTS